MASRFQALPGAATPSRRDRSARHGWDDAAVALLKALWADPANTAAVIGRRLGVSRSAVLGKLHRLGLSNRRPEGPRATSRPPSTPKAPRVPRAPRAPAPTASSPADRTPPGDVGPGLVARLEDLARHRCHWPIGDPHSPAFRWCGRPARVPPYCEGHRRLAHASGGAGRRDRGPGGMRG